MVPVEVFGVQIEATTGSPLVLLREVADPHRVLPIFVGGPEAFAIAVGLEGLEVERPLTHDLLADVMARTDTHLDDVMVTELREGTFFAELHLRGPDGLHTVASRPSDAIALAVRMHAPVFAAEDVLAEAGAMLQVVADTGDDTDAEDTDGDGERDRPSEQAIDEAVGVFRSVLDGVDPADFGDAGEADGGPFGERPGNN